MLSALVASLALVALQEGRVPATPEDQRLVTLFQPEDDLADLVEATVKFLGIAIEFTPSEVQGQVALRLPGPISNAELLDTMHRALAMRGLTTVQTPGSASLSVVKLADAAALARLEDGGPARAGFQKVLLELASERVDSTAEAVKLVLSKQGSVNAFKDARRLVVADLAPHIAQARRIVAAVDRSLDERAVIEIPLQRTAPVALTALIERVANAEKVAFGDR